MFMSSFRLAVWPLLLLAACYTPLASAIGLGEIRLHSALAEPLTADIELIDARGLGVDDIKVRLAPSDVFARAGVERPDFLAKLSFVPALDGSGQRIRVSSTAPVNEPYLNFIVELSLPGGQLLREYTLLLDPPLYQPDLPALPRAQPQAPAIVSAPPVEPPRARVLPAVEQGTRYRIQPGDSLWAITQRLEGRAVGSHEALMADLYALNPDAFIGGDRNRLRVGADLLLPDGLQHATPRPTTQVAAAPREADAAIPPPEHTARQTPVTADRGLVDVLSQLEAQVLSLQAQMDAQNRLLAEAQRSLAQRETSPLAAESAVVTAPVPREVSVERQAPASPVPAPAAPAMTAQPDSLASPWLLALPVLFLLGGLLLQRRRASAAATAAIMVEARPAGVKRAEASFPDINPFQRQVPVVTEMTMDEYLGHGPDMPAPVAAPVQPMPSLDDMILSLPTDLDELIGIAPAPAPATDAQWRERLNEAIGCIDRGEVNRASGLLTALLDRPDDDHFIDEQLARSA